MIDNILFLGHPQVSHALDTFFDGCLKVFGQANVYEYPILEKHHCVDNYDSFNLHTDIQPVYGWWCKNNMAFKEEFYLDEWAKKINNREIRYIVGSNRAMDNFIELLGLIEAESLQHICVVFVEEEHDLDFELHKANVNMLMPVWDKIDIYYRMDFVRGSVCPSDKIKPFYMSAREDKILEEIGFVKPFDDREFDVCYLVGPNHPNRRMYYDIINELKVGSNLIEFGTHNYSLNQYLNVINNSKIFVSVRGNELSNTRNIEGPFCGSALFTENIGIELPFDYEDGKSAIYYDSFNVLELLTSYVLNQEKLRHLASKSRQHCLGFHTSTRRAEQLLAEAKKIKGW